MIEKGSKPGRWVPSTEPLPWGPHTRHTCPPHPAPGAGEGARAQVSCVLQREAEWGRVPMAQPGCLQPSAPPPFFPSLLPSPLPLPPPFSLLPLPGAQALALRQDSAQTPGRSSRGPGTEQATFAHLWAGRGLQPGAPDARASSTRPTPPAELLAFVKNTQHHLGNMQFHRLFKKQPRLVLRPACISEMGLPRPRGIVLTWGRPGLGALRLGLLLCDCGPEPGHPARTPVRSGRGDGNWPTWPGPRLYWGSGMPWKPVPPEPRCDSVGRRVLQLWVRLEWAGPAPMTGVPTSRDHRDLQGGGPVGRRPLDRGGAGVTRPQSEGRQGPQLGRGRKDPLEPPEEPPPDTWEPGLWAPRG